MIWVLLLIHFAVLPTPATSFERVGVENGLRTDDIIQWKGKVNTLRRPSTLTLYSGRRYKLLKLNIQGNRSRLTIGAAFLNRDRICHSDAIQPGRDFDVIVLAKPQRFLVYLNGRLKFNHNLPPRGRGIGHVRSIASYFGRNDTVLKILTDQDISDMLSTPNCGRSRRDIEVPSICSTLWQSAGATPRIVLSTDAPPGGHPWQAAIRKRKAYSRTGSPHVCGATLIARCWVVTAAHCFTGVQSRSLRQYLVRIGDYYNDDSNRNTSSFAGKENSVDVGISYVIRHERYFSLPALENDIALIRLASCVKFDTFKRPACLPANENVIRGRGIHCGKTGWGAFHSIYHSAPEYPDCLQAEEVQVQDQATCKTRLGGSYSPQQMICAVPHRRDICMSDSGGPLTCNSPDRDGDRHYLWGITSWGKGCGNSVRAETYTRVVNYLRWIFINTQLTPSPGRQNQGETAGCV